MLVKENIMLKQEIIKIAKKGRPLKCKNSFWNLLMIKFDMVLSKLIETVLVQKGGKYVQVVFSVVWSSNKNLNLPYQVGCKYTLKEILVSSNIFYKKLKLWRYPAIIFGIITLKKIRSKLFLVSLIALNPWLVRCH